MNIIDLINLKLLGINALFITGLYYCCDYDLNQERKPAEDAKNILWFVKWWLVRKAPLWITKPLCGCMMCMASIWGLAFLLPTFNWMHLEWSMLLQVVVYCMVLCGLNRIIYHFT